MTTTRGAEVDRFDAAILASEQAREGAQVLAGQLRDLFPVPGVPIEPADEARAWQTLRHGEWHLIGLSEADGGFGLSLRDLSEFAMAVGRTLAPVPLSVAWALGDHGADPALGTVEQTRSLAVLWAAEAVGGTAKLAEDMVDHALVREQFGRPIGQFQAVKHLAAQAEWLRQEALTALTWASTGPLDRGCLAILFDRCLAVGELVGQVHGGIGMTWEIGHHHYTRRTVALRDQVRDLIERKELLGGVH